MKKISFIIIFLLSSAHVFSQENIVNKNQQEVNKQLPSLTQEQINNLNNLLNQQKYEEFYKTISSSNLNDESYLSYLLSKKDEGHAPIYWLLAEQYTKLNKPQDTHKWYYIASIYTQQESYLCEDETSRNAPRILIKQFNKPQELITRTPQYIESSMREVSFFLTNLHNRPNPNWVCNFGSDPSKQNKDILIPKNNWPSTRQMVLKRFTDKFEQ